MAKPTLIKYQYYSKWRKEWIDFTKPPTDLELVKMKDYFYQIRVKPSKM